MTDKIASIRHALDRVEDPEIAISLRDLGVLREVQVTDSHVQVRLVPTRVACPGRALMASRVREAVESVDSTLAVDIIWDHESWDPGDISPVGCSVLHQQGFVAESAADPVCPYCGGLELRPAGDFGGSLCKRPFTCSSCGSTVDMLAGASLPRVRVT